MQDNDNEWQSIPKGRQSDEDAEFALVPPSLLSNVLHHLELSPEQAPSESSLDDLLLKLRSRTWEERALALRSLERLSYPVSLDLLSPFLHDEDETVRASIVSLLGTMGKQTPIHWLVEALHDPCWQVREASVFALAKQGSRIPKEVLMAALHDKDGSVHEAASFVLYQNPVDETLSTPYGHLREVIPMQQELYDSNHLNNKPDTYTPENAPTNDWNGAFMEYSNPSAHTHSVSEQAQAYAAGQYAPHNATSHEVPSDAYAEITPSRHEKITSYRLRSKSHKSWWIITLVVVAFLFLGVGRLSIMVVPQSVSILPDSKNPVNISVPNKSGDPLSSLPFSNVAFTAHTLNKLATELRFTSDQFVAEVEQHHGSVAAVATIQGIPAAQLKIFELQATQAGIDAAVKQGAISSLEGAQVQVQLQDNGGLLEKVIQTSIDNYIQYS